MDLFKLNVSHDDVETNNSPFPHQFESKNPNGTNPSFPHTLLVSSLSLYFGFHCWVLKQICGVAQAMEVQSLSFENNILWVGSFVEALVLDTFLATAKSLACFVILVLLWKKKSLFSFVTRHLRFPQLCLSQLHNLYIFATISVENFFALLGLHIFATVFFAYLIFFLFISFSSILLLECSLSL